MLCNLSYVLSILFMFCFLHTHTHNIQSQQTKQVKNIKMDTSDWEFDLYGGDNDKEKGVIEMCCITFK